MKGRAVKGRAMRSRAVKQGIERQYSEQKAAEKIGRQSNKSQSARCSITDAFLLLLVSVDGDVHTKMVFETQTVCQTTLRPTVVTSKGLPILPGHCSTCVKHHSLVPGCVQSHKTLTHKTKLTTMGQS